MIKQTIWVWLVCGFALSSKEKLYAQNDTTDISYFFEDDPSYLRNIIKFNLISPLTGDYSVYYERKLSDVITLEIGLGFFSPEYSLINVSGPFHFGGYSSTNEDINPGLSIWLQPKFFFLETAPESGYVSFGYGQKRFQANGENIELNEYVLTIGNQFQIHDDLTFGFEYGYGIRDRQPYNFTEGYFDDMDVLMIVGIKVGYIL